MKSLLILAAALTVLGCGADQGQYEDDPVATSEEDLSLSMCMIDDHFTTFEYNSNGWDSDYTTSVRPTADYCDDHFDVSYANVQGRDLHAGAHWIGTNPSDAASCESASLKMTAYGEWINKYTRRRYWHSQGTTTCTGQWHEGGVDAGAGGYAGAPQEGSCLLTCASDFSDFGYTRLRLQVEADSNAGSSRVSVTMIAQQ